MIALICEKREQEWLKMLLSEFGDVELFKDGISFAFYLQQGGLCRLAVVAKDSAEGMNDCSYAIHDSTPTPVLWISEQAEFLNQSKRMDVAGFLVKPVADDALRETVKQILARGG